MKELELDAIAMAPINTPKKKQWVFHGRMDGEPCRIIVNLGDHQFRLIEAEAAVDAPCA